MQQNPFKQFGFSGQGNPLLASMESLRKAWEGMPNNPLSPLTPLQLQSPEELDKRIKELQAVENWLNLNLSMLRNTIQALEIQKSTLATFQAFSQMPWPGTGTPSEPSASNEAQTETQQAQDTPQGEGTQSEDDAQSEQAKSPDFAVPDENLMEMGKAWWGLMQQQFQTLVQQTQSGTQAAQEVAQKMGQQAQQASADSTFGRKGNPSGESSNQKQSKTQKSSSVKQSAAAKKTAAKGSVAKKTAAGKRSSGKKRGAKKST